MDAFEVYREWFRAHYGRDFVCSREQWQEWCSRPGRALEAHDARVIDLLADQREIDRERSEGWAYGQVR